MYVFFMYVCVYIDICIYIYIYTHTYMNNASQILTSFSHPPFSFFAFSYPLALAEHSALTAVNGSWSLAADGEACVQSLAYISSVCRQRTPSSTPLKTLLASDLAVKQSGLSC